MSSFVKLDIEKAELLTQTDSDGSCRRYLCLFKTGETLPVVVKIDEFDYSRIKQNCSHDTSEGLDQVPAVADTALHGEAGSGQVN